MRRSRQSCRTYWRSARSISGSSSAVRHSARPPGDLDALESTSPTRWHRPRRLPSPVFVSLPGSPSLGLPIRWLGDRVRFDGVTPTRSRARRRRSPGTLACVYVRHLRHRPASGTTWTRSPCSMRRGVLSIGDELLFSLAAGSRRSRSTPTRECRDPVPSGPVTSSLAFQAPTIALYAPAPPQSHPDGRAERARHRVGCTSALRAGTAGDTTPFLRQLPAIPGNPRRTISTATASATVRQRPRVYQTNRQDSDGDGAGNTAARRATGGVESAGPQPLHRRPVLRGRRVRTERLQALHPTATRHVDVCQ
jgi:hypothetical protein